MKAVGLYQYLPANNDACLQDVDIEKPVLKEQDLLIQVKAIAVNPVDTKVRSPKPGEHKEAKILGWDAAGVVLETGRHVTTWKPGDVVYYCGDINRQGCNSEYHVVDQRIVGQKPQSLTFAEAAALPLTALTAWEALFDRLRMDPSGRDSVKSILIIGGAGGVGSIAIQLAKQLAEVTVIATASRPETVAWCRQMGADVIVNHNENMVDELTRAGYPQVDYILCNNDVDAHWAAITRLIRPQGLICSVVSNREPLEMNTLKNKSAGLVWEFVFTRPTMETADMLRQQQILNEISKRVDSGQLVTTCRQVLRPINAENLRKAHRLIESNTTIGKISLADW